MKLTGEKKVTYYNYKVNMSDEEFDILRKHGLRAIQKDDEAIINYAIIDGIKSYLKSLPKKKKVRKQ